MSDKLARRWCALLGLTVILPILLLAAIHAMRLLAHRQVQPPAPTEIIQALATALSRPIPVSGQIVFLRDLMLVSAWRVLMALVVSVAIGVVIGFLLTMHRLIWATAQPSVDFLRSLPVTLLAPAAAALQGIANPSLPWELAAIPCTLIIALQVRNGMERIPEERIHAFRALSAISHPLQIFRYLIIWEMAPDVMAGIRIAGSYAIVVVSVLEYSGIGSLELGFGAFIAEAANNTAQPPELYAGLLIFGLLGFAVNRALEALDDHISARRRI